MLESGEAIAGGRWPVQLRAGPEIEPLSTRIFSNSPTSAIDASKPFAIAGQGEEPDT